MGIDKMKNCKKSYCIKICILMMLLCILLSACDNRATVDNANDTLFIEGNGIGKQGVLSVVSGVITYFDYETGKGTVLCTRAQCMHELYDKDTNPNPECPAVSPDKSPIVTAFLANNNLYFATEGHIDMETGIRATKLYKADLDGENRVYLGEVVYGFRTFRSYVYKNYIFGLVNSIKVISDEEGVVSSESTLQAVALNIDTLEIINLSEPDEVESDLHAYVYDNKLYCTFQKYDKEAHEQSKELRVFSLDDFSLVDRFKTTGFSNIIYLKDHMYYSYTPDGADHTQLCKRNLKTNKETVLLLIENSENVTCGLSDVTEDYMIYSLLYYDNVNPAEDRGSFAFNMKDNSVKEVDFAYSGIYARVYKVLEDDYLLLRFFEEGKSAYRYIKTEDFINKSLDYVEVRPF